MRLRSAAAGETGTPEAADVSSSAASATQPQHSLLQAHAVMHRVTSEIMSLSSYTLASMTVRPTRRRQKPRMSQSWLNRSLLSRLPEALEASQIVVTSSNRPTSQTLRLLDEVVRLRARKAMTLATGTILTVMQSCIRVRVIGMILVSVLLLTPDKRLLIATSCVLLLRRIRGHLLRGCWLDCLTRRVIVIE
uniref:Uncharacterized protein n=1 Tax=Hyaloperonospora arabidopsidis (strain Emoy2) TaxID=559515 RepID=M4BFN2_HYAAE